MNQIININSASSSPKETKKKRKKAIKNEEVIEKLSNAGFDKKEFINGDLASKSYQYVPSKSYYVPLDIYKKHIVKTFKPQIPIGTTVRLCPSKRKYGRNPYYQDLGDSKNWGHLGMGSGKRYHSSEIENILDSYGLGTGSVNTWYSRARRRGHLSKLNTKITIGNNSFPSNLLSSQQKVNYYKNNNIKKKSWYLPSGVDFEIDDFIKRIKIKGDGIFGPKKLINGYITNVYVHFLYPTWTRKREARYEILFETGAKGIFTNDIIEKVYDIDYDFNDKLMICSEANSNCKGECSHDEVHKERLNCKDVCLERNVTCVPLFDYSNLMSTTYGKALDYSSEEEE